MQQLNTAASELAAHTDELMIDDIDLRPDPTFLYRYFDAQGTLLYVGISKSYMARFAQHKSTKNWIYDVKQITLEVLETRDLAHEKEIEAIATEKPLYNIAHQVNATNIFTSLESLEFTYSKDERDRIDLVIAKMPTYDLTELMELCNGGIFRLEKITGYSFWLPNEDNKPRDVFQYILIHDLLKLFNSAWEECLHYEKDNLNLSEMLLEHTQYKNYLKLLTLTDDIINNLGLKNQPTMKYMGIMHCGKTWLGDLGAKMQEIFISHDKFTYRPRQQCNN